MYLARSAAPSVPPRRRTLTLQGAAGLARCAGIGCSSRHPANASSWVRTAVRARYARRVRSWHRRIASGGAKMTLRRLSAPGRQYGRWGASAAHRRAPGCPSMRAVAAARRRPSAVTRRILGHSAPEFIALRIVHFKASKGLSPSLFPAPAGAPEPFALLRRLPRPEGAVARPPGREVRPPEARRGVSRSCSGEDAASPQAYPDQLFGTGHRSWSPWRRCCPPSEAGAVGLWTSPDPGFDRPAGSIQARYTCRRPTPADAGRSGPSLRRSPFLVPAYSFR